MFLPLRSLRCCSRFGIGSSLLLAILLATGCGGSKTGVSTTPSITVVGSGQVRLGATDQFTATVTNESSTAVTWQVNGITGGNSAVGMISTTGIYTPPAAIPNPNA